MRVAPPWRGMRPPSILAHESPALAQTGLARGVRWPRGMATAAATAEKVVYERRRPERTSLYEVVRDNLETLYGAIDDGALDVRVPKHARKALEGYLDCGLLCR